MGMTACGAHAICTDLVMVMVMVVMIVTMMMVAIVTVAMTVMAGCRSARERELRA